jgi:Flp pilus assembly protein TadD
MVYSMERFDDAIVELRNGLNQDPEDAYCHGLLGVIYSQQKKKKEATDATNLSLKFEPDGAYVHYMASICFGNIGLAKASENAIITALSIDADNATFHERYAAILANKGKWKDALSELDIALEIDPHHQAAMSLRTKALTALGRKKEAELNTKLLVQMSPDTAGPHMDAGLVALSRGDKDAAYKSFHEALRLNPNSQRAREGVLDALRSRYFWFRWFYAYRLWLESLPAGARSMAWIGFYVLPRILLDADHELPTSLRVPLAIVGVSFGLLIVFSIIAKPITNVFLNFNPMGRLLLTAHQRAEALFLTFCLIVVAISLLSGIVTQRDGFYLLAVLTMLIGGLSTLLTLTRDSGRLRWVMFGVFACLEAVIIVYSPWMIIGPSQ